MSLLSFNKNKIARGFTLVELMVSISIMLVIITMVAMNQNNYTSGASLKNLANDISLSIREAQIYGISVKELTRDVFSSSYGVVFSTDSDKTTSYIFFADVASNSNHYYDGSWNCNNTDGECLTKNEITNNNKISRLCVIKSDYSEDCNMNRVDIAFVRPKTEANFIFNGTPGYNASAIGVRVELASATEVRSVIVYTTGQISVK